MINLHMRNNLGYIQGLKDFVDNLPNNIDMIEIGCYAGESTKIFLDSGKIRNMTVIDPYIDDYDIIDTYSRLYRMEDVYNTFKTNILSVYENVTLLKKLSNDAVRDLSGKLVDLVYIDGCHQYENVRVDILNYLPFIKSGGIIGGHDYHYGWAGVIKAVDEQFTKPDKVYSDTSWMVKL